MEKQLPVKCPSCSTVLTVERFACPNCQTSVEGSFAMPLLARLSIEEQELALHLIKASGSLKDLAAIYRVSYPTIRNRVDDLIQRLHALDAEIEKEAQS